MKKQLLVLCPLLLSPRLCADATQAEKPQEKPMMTIERKEEPKKTTSTRLTSISGLVEYEVIKEGTGETTPRKGQLISVHYTGWLSDKGQPGRKFDSSLDRDRKKPFQFTLGVGHVIRGWDEGVMGMKVGEKRRLFIPASEAYGTRGHGATIPPNSDLIFDVELIKIGS